MKNLLFLGGILLLFAATTAAQATPAGNSAQPGADDAAVRKNIEGYLRHLFAWGPDVKVAIGPLKDSGVAGLLETTADVALGEQKDSAKLYISRDGRYMFRGEVSDLTKDPTADIRAKLQLQDAPSKGDLKAPVTLVEFADFQCPVCRQLHDLLRTILPAYPQVRLVFKDFPLTNIHPWARTAALAGRCAYNQNPKAFWTLYDKIYDDQEVISAENAWDKMMDYAAQAGLRQDTFKACMAGPEAGKAIDESFANGQAVEVASTPTTFVNGRRMVGADHSLLEQFIRYELAQKKAAGTGTKP